MLFIDFMTNPQDQFKEIKLQYHMVEKGDLVELGSRRTAYFKRCGSECEG